MDDLHEQLDRLEAEIAAMRLETARLRQASRPRRLLSTTVLVVSMVAFGAWVERGQGGTASASVPQRVTAPFEVVDSAGKVLVRISGAPGGDGQIMVMAQSGQTGAAISGDGNVGVYSGGDNVAVLKADVNGRGAVVVGEGGRRIAVMTSDGANQGLLTLSDAQNRPGAALSGDGNIGVFYGGKAVAGMKAEGEGQGALLVGDGQGKHIARLSVDPANRTSALLLLNGSGVKPLLKVSEKAARGDARVTIGAGSGGYDVTVVSQSGSLVAAMGEAVKVGGGAVVAYNAAGTVGSILSGTGQIHVADSSGKTLATMVAENGGGAFSVRNPSGVTIVRLGQGKHGGLLQLADEGGSAMIEAGSFPGRGIVRAYPLGHPGMGLVGMPGTFISGLVVR
jgi:hypothetical protein